MNSLIFALLIMLLESEWFRLWRIKYQAKRKRKWKIIRNHQTDLQDLAVVDEAAAALGMRKEESRFGMCIRNLSKEYPFSVPVDLLNLYVMNGEVFGLLGGRGSDKDELVHLLAGTVEPTAGDVFFNGKTLNSDYREYLLHIGYCPYESPFLEELTGKETMLLLGSLRQTRPETMEGILSNLALKLFILHDLNNPIYKYSNSVLRKFTAACAMLGNPRLCIFDEPSIGIDAESRFFLWNCIRSLAKGGCTIIISSHNMEECQDFCTKIGMFINGKMRCIGTVTELQARHSVGYAVVVRFSPNFTERHFTTIEDSHKIASVEAEKVSKNERRLMEKVPVDDYITSRLKLGLPTEDDDESELDVQSFLDYRAMVAHNLGAVNVTIDILKAIRPEDLAHWEKDLLPFMKYFEKRIQSSLVDIQPNFLFYHIDRDACKWSDIFTAMEEAKLLDWPSPIETYYVGATSLEQTFLNYIRGQQPKGETTL